MEFIETVLHYVGDVVIDFINNKITKIIKTDQTIKKCTSESKNIQI